MKKLYKQNAAQQILHVADSADASALHRRSALNLPAPQVNDLEMIETQKTISKMESMSMPPPMMSMNTNASNSSTRNLLGN